jgi:hypothetical protein
MDSQLFDDLQKTVEQQGPTGAIDRLCQELRERKDYANLFYAMLMKKRFELGVSPVPTGSSQDLPAAMHVPYEDAIRQAGRLVGQLYLDEGNIPNAWAFFRMLGEPEPVKEAIEKVKVGEGEDAHPIVNIAFHEGVHPRKGFDLMLERFGICSAITTLGSGEHNHPFEVRAYCVKRLIRALYQELRERLRTEITQQQGFPPTATSVRELMAGRDWLFQDDFYHVDVSHLSAVVQMSTQLDACEELDMARELCAYGQKLSPRFQYNSDPPFEDQYRDYGVYLAVLAGDSVDEGIAHFRAKVEQTNPEEVGTYPAEILVNLLLRLDRPQEALQVARKYLTTADEGRLSCPNVVELCQRTRDFRTLTEVAREHGNPVHFVAGLIAARNGT